MGRSGTPVDGVVELGREGSFPFSPAISELSVDLAVGAGGVAWLNVSAERRGVLATLDGSTWSYPMWPDGADGIGAIEATPDGAAWVMEESFDPSSRVAHILDGEWSVLPALDDPFLAGFFDGDGPGYGGFRDGYLAASAGGSVWRQYLDGLNVNRLGVSPDGSVCATALSGCPGPLADSPTPTCPNPDLDGAGLYVITPEAVAAIE